MKSSQKLPHELQNNRILSTVLQKKQKEQGRPSGSTSPRGHQALGGVMGRPPRPSARLRFSQMHSAVNRVPVEEGVEQEEEWEERGKRKKWNGKEEEERDRGMGKKRRKRKE